VAKEQLQARFISNAEALEILEKRWKELGEKVSKLEYRPIDRAVRHLRDVVKCDLEKVKDLDKFLQELNLEEEVRVVIENICPQEKGLLRVLLDISSDVELSEEEMDVIIEKIKTLLSSSEK